MAGGSPPGAALIPRTVDVLRAFDENHRQRTLADLASVTGLSSATALRIARQLVEAGALKRLPDGSYTIGRLIWELGLLAAEQSDVIEIASPYLHDIHLATRATVHFAVRDGDRALCLARLSGHASLSVESRTGSRFPLHATGVGKVLLSAAPEEVQREVLRNLERFTPYTITQPGTLSRQLQRCGRDGYATTEEERFLGVCAVAVPVRLGSDIVAAIGVVVPRFGSTRASLISALRVAAQGLSRQLARPVEGGRSDRIKGLTPTAVHFPNVIGLSDVG